MKKKLLVLLLIAVMVVFAAVGCRPVEIPPPAPTETPEETPDETPEAREMDYEDGTYTGELEPDERGWTSVVELVVEDGKITEVDYDELDEDGNRKSEDEEYNERWKSAAGTSAPEAYPALEEQLIEVQDIEAVDAISGATATSRDFRDVVAQAIEAGPQED